MVKLSEDGVLLHACHVSHAISIVFSPCIVYILEALRYAAFHTVDLMEMCRNREG